jgi:hypothetical protein
LFFVLTPLALLEIFGIHFFIVNQLSKQTGEPPCSGRWRCMVIQRQNSGNLPKSWVFFYQKRW